MLIDKLQPHSIEIEQHVLCAMMLSPKAIDSVCEIISAEDYYDKNHQHIHDAIVAIASSDKPVDQLTLAEELRRKNQLEKIGGVIYLAKIASIGVTAHNASYHAKIIRDKAISRQLITASGELLTAAYDDLEPVQSLLDKAQASVESIANGVIETTECKAEQLLHEVFDKIEELHQLGSRMSGIPTGFIELDNLTDGWKRNDLIIVAAITSMGKSALSAQFGNEACRNGHGVVIFSTEMSKEQWMQRILSSECEVPFARIINGSVRDDEWIKITNSCGRIAGWNMLFYDDAAPTPQSIERRVRILQRKYSLGLVIVDYLQLLSHQGKSDTQEEEIRKITRALKGAAKRLRLPILCMAQLNRGVHARADSRPKLSDLRGSGTIEQDADVVIFIHRPEHGIDNQIDKAEIIVAKQRNGPVGSFWVQWEGEYMRFVQDVDRIYLQHNND